MYLNVYLYLILKKENFLNFFKLATNCSENHFKKWIDKDEDKNTVAKCSDNEILTFYENFVETNKPPMRKAENY